MGTCSALCTRNRKTLFFIGRMKLHNFLLCNSLPEILSARVRLLGAPLAAMGGMRHKELVAARRLYETVII